MATAEAGRRTDSGIEIRRRYVADDLEGFDPAAELGEPGAYPYTRGVQRDMYRGRLWTMRQYAGFGTAGATNERFKFLLEAGQTGLSCAFDLPTQMGYDSDHPRAEGEVGKVGVAIDSIEDMRELLAGLPLDQVSTSMTINATAAILLLLYELVAAEQGVAPSSISGTIQNDILKEYVARGTYIYPPRPSMRLVTDTFAYCAERIPDWNTISISGYHIREAGSTAVQELAFTLANGIAYVQAALDAGLDVDAFGPRLSFFFNAHNDLFQEVAKYRAARRIWARIMTERFGARDERSKRLRFHTQTGGSTLTAQQSDNNIVRVALQALSAVLGRHPEPPHEQLRRGDRAADRARGQARAAHPAGHRLRVRRDRHRRPPGGFLFPRNPHQRGGACRARLHRRASTSSAGRWRRSRPASCKTRSSRPPTSTRRPSSRATQVVVGVNRFAEEDAGEPEVFPIDPSLQQAQVERLQSAEGIAGPGRPSTQRSTTYGPLPAGTQNLLVPMREALKRRATLGEVSDALREVFGEYQPNR